MTDFADLSRRSQLRHLRASAEAVLAEYGITDAELRLKQLDFNATYRVDSAAGRFALRINVNSPHTAEAVAAEAAWVEAVANDTDLLVPRPLRTPAGAASTTARVEGLDRDLGAVVYSWLPGRDVGEEAPRVRLRALGTAMATLHEHTASWTHPSISNRPTFAGVFMDEPDRITSEDRWITKKARGPIGDALEQISETTAPVWRRKRQLIHADLHIWNAKWSDGGLSVFDFDDCGRGLPLHDLAITSYYLRDDPGAEDAVRAGYESVRPLPQHTDGEFEALVAGRNLLLLNAVLESVTADMADFLPGYVDKTAGRMRNYLTTGRFEL